MSEMMSRHGVRIMLLVALLLALVAFPGSAQETKTVIVPSMTAEEIDEYLMSASCSFISNPGFEDGPVAWSQTGSQQIWELSDEAWGGDWLAWQCGYDNCHDHVWQNVDFTGYGDPVMFLYWKLSSQDVGRPYDVFAGYINDSAGNPLYGLYGFNNLTQPKDQWCWESWNLSGLGLDDSEWQVSFTGITDLARPTSFYLDDVLVCGLSLKKIYIPVTFKNAW